MPIQYFKNLDKSKNDDGANCKVSLKILKYFEPFLFYYTIL